MLDRTDDDHRQPQSVLDIVADSENPSGGLGNAATLSSLEKDQTIPSCEDVQSEVRLRF